VINQKELTRSVFDLFEKVRRQAAMYNESFKKLEYNMTIFDKLVEELAVIDKEIHAEKDEAISDIQHKLVTAVDSLEQEKRNLLKEIGDTEKLHELIKKFYLEFDKHNEKINQQQLRYDKLIEQIEKSRKEIRENSREINKIREEFANVLMDLKSSSSSMLKKQLERLESQFSQTIHDQYKELEIYNHNRQLIFEKRMISYYDRLENDALAMQKRLTNEYSSIGSRLNVIDNLVTNKITADETYKRDVGTMIDAHKKELQNFEKAFAEIRELDIETLANVTDEFQNSTIARKADIKNVVNKELQSIQEGLKNANRKNNIALIFSVVCIIATMVLIIISG
jgi:DNA repair exonuclease SbcCD ATPase subunit